MQASPLVGAPWRSTSKIARSSSGPYSLPYLICRSNLILGVLMQVEMPGVFMNRLERTILKLAQPAAKPSGRARQAHRSLFDGGWPTPVRAAVNRGDAAKSEIKPPRISASEFSGEHAP